MSQLAFDESLVLILNDKLTCEQVESALADRLYEAGYVKESYKPALLEREKTFPTALDVKGINAAIPHCAVENVNEGALCAGILKQPATWQKMDDASQSCEVSLVIMLALTDPGAHLSMLRKVIAVIQDQELMQRIVSSETAAEAYGLLAGPLS